MSYYIKGDKERGKEVIAMLEAKGGVNKYGCGGEYIDNLYFINKEGVITTCCINIGNPVFELCEELTLPESSKPWTPKYETGDYVKVKSTNNVQLVYNCSCVKQAYRLEDGNWYKDSEIEKWEPQRGERILVRDSNIVRWKEAIFSFRVDNLYYVLGGNSWIFCNPFDINKLGKI